MISVVNKVLLFLLLAIFLKQLAWATFIPLWQFPDEQAHFGQVQNLAETGSIRKQGNNLSNEVWQAEMAMGTNRDSFGNNRYTYHSEYNIPYSPTTSGFLESTLAHLPVQSRTEYLKSESTGYPPLYYGLAAVIYKLVYSGSIFDRVFADRIATSFLALGIAFLTFKIGLTIYKNKFMAAVLSVLVTFQPMFSFAQAGVTSDALFNFLFTLFLFVCFRLLDKGINLTDTILVAIVLIASYFTKPQFNILIFILLPLLIFLLVRDHKGRQSGKLVINRELIIVFGLCLLGLFGIVQRLFWGMSFLPETNGQTVPLDFPKIWEHLTFTLGHTYREVLPWYWGVFRWLSLGLPDSLRHLTSVLTGVSFVSFSCLLLVFLLKGDRTKRTQMLAFAFFAVIVYFLALTVFDYGFRQSHGFSFGIQGRYFFPVITAQMIIFLEGITLLLPKLWKRTGAWLLSAGMIFLHAIVFFWVVSSYYAFSYPDFFQQASQYKPIWLKMPVNTVILFMAVLASLYAIPVIYRLKESSHEKDL